MINHCRSARIDSIIALFGCGADGISIASFFLLWRVRRNWLGKCFSAQRHCMRLWLGEEYERMGDGQTAGHWNLGAGE